MATLILLALALFAGLACSTPTSRIAGGAPAKAADYPSVVQVEFSTGPGTWSQSCGGNILTASFVLSAAHCFHGVFYQPSNRRIRAGSTIRNYGGQVAYVEKEINYPTYGVNDMDGDLSLVKLLTSLKYDAYVQQGAIITQGFVLPDNLPVDVAGWGATEIGGIPSNDLRHAQVFIVNREVCASRYESLSIPRAVTENMICASVLDVGGGDACQGDFGGPLYYGQILVGIISWGEGCGNNAYPSVATSVASYTDWIVEAAV